MKSYLIEKNYLILNVKKSPLLIRIILFFLSFSSFIVPFLGIVFNLLLEGRFHFGFLIGFFLFGLIGFYFLRQSLWNTYGREILHFNNNEVQYEVDYGWFKDKIKILQFECFKYSIKRVGYEEDNKGVLIIEDDSNKIETVVKIPIKQLEELIINLNRIQVNN